jgi:hypothetical protein
MAGTSTRRSETGSGRRQQTRAERLARATQQAANEPVGAPLFARDYRCFSSTMHDYEVDGERIEEVRVEGEGAAIRGPHRDERFAWIEEGDKSQWPIERTLERLEIFDPSLVLQVEVRVFENFASGGRCGSDAGEVFRVIDRIAPGPGGVLQAERTPKR